MTRHRAHVRNAADSQQVKRAGRRDRDDDARRLDAMRTVLQTPDGRRVFWDLLVRASVFESIWNPNVQIHYNAGRQDFGHQLMADLLMADEDAYDVMQQEARARLRQTAHELDAEQQEPAGGRATTQE